MTSQFRFGDYAQEISVHERNLSYNELAPKVRRDASGAELAWRPEKLKLRPVDVYRLLQPYVSVRLRDQLRAVVPLAVYLFLFQSVILHQDVENSGVIASGLLAVVLGLMLFMEGLRTGFMPFGEAIGTILPAKSPLPLVLVITFLLGIGCTLAEPAIGALQAAGSHIDVKRAPYLYEILNHWTGALVLVIGSGVGGAAVLGTLRFIYGWSLKPLLYLAVVPTLGLTGQIMADKDLRDILGVAWDCGAITTGPVTVPLVLSLGVGIASAAGKGRSSLSGFGIVSLASMFPILGVLLLSMIVAETATPADIIAHAAARSAAGLQHWYQRTPWNETILGLRAVVPLTVFLFVVMRFVLREKIRNRVQTVYGLSLCVLGMILFNIGLSYGLAKLGGQSGEIVPAAFTRIAPVTGSPLYTVALGIVIAGLFAWFLGFLSTLAEPALNALGQTVENLSNGAFRKPVLLYAVAVGVAAGVTLGIFKIIFHLPLGWILIPAYAAALLLTAASSEEYVNIAWDGAAVTTGPVTVPLVLAMGLGFGNAVGAVEGFGVLAIASIGPILTVLATGLWVQWKIRRRHELEDRESLEAEVAVQ